MTDVKPDKSSAQLFVDLIDLANRYLRQEVAATIERAVVKPLKRVGFWLAVTIAASTLFALASIFFAVGAFQLLAQLVGAAWLAYLIVGGVLFVTAVFLLIIAKRIGE